MVAYALLEDGMSDPKWTQANDFGKDNFEGPYWDLFCGKEFMVKGIIYDDVVVSFPSPKGIEHSIPSAISGETDYKHSSILYLKDAVCQYIGAPTYGQSLIKDPDKLRVVALLIDGKTGNVCNAASSGYSKDAPLYKDPSGISLPVMNEEESETLSTDYFTLEGIRLNNLPENGTVIMVHHKADGTTVAEKRTH